MGRILRQRTEDIEVRLCNYFLASIKTKDYLDDPRMMTILVIMMTMRMDEVVTIAFNNEDG